MHFHFIDERFAPAILESFHRMQSRCNGSAARFPAFTTRKTLERFLVDVKKISTASNLHVPLKRLATGFRHCPRARQDLPCAKNNTVPNTGKILGGTRQKWMKGKSMYKTGTMILAVAMSAMAFSAAPAFAQDRERTNVAAPDYPRGAERRGVEGYAVVEYSVTPDGTIENPTVVDASPAGVFDRAVINAIEAWRYAPAAAATEGLTQRFDFSLGG